MDSKSRNMDNFDPYGKNSESTPLQSSSQRDSTKIKILLGLSIVLTAVLITVLIVGGVFYFRTMKDLRTAIKTYHVTDNSGPKPVTEDITVDTEKSIVVAKPTGEGIEPGTFAVVDYVKSVIGFYSPESKKCYLISGIPSQVLDPKSLSEKLENTTVQTIKQTLKYEVNDAYPVSDKDLLPSELSNACKHLPVYWLEPAAEKKDGLEKRSCWSICIGIWSVAICLQRCG